jgi:hypothetical protein
MSASGLLVRCNGELAFIPAPQVRFIRYDVVVTPFPGREVGMALLDGRVVPVISLGPQVRALVVCDIDGETIAVSGLEPMRSGFFEGDEQGPIEDGRLVPTVPLKHRLELSRNQKPTQYSRSEEEPWLS